ncbi:MAG TPA: hypothetical protein VGV86_16190 [Acidimicrobiales bacterium]|nr:hypothetical protein [Acidimicrobiales bacterium]
MRHPTEGVLRRVLDEPAGVSDTDRQHVAECGECLGALALMREDAALVNAALATESVATVDVDAAWRRMSTTGLAPDPGRVVTPLRPSRSRGVLRRPAVAALAVAVVLTGAGTAAANDWLQIFRTKRIAPVTFSTSDLIALPDLSAYGELDVTSEVDVNPVADKAAAAAATGLRVPEVTTLPRGVSGEPGYQVGREASATFTFSADRAARTAAEAGRTLPAPPPGLDGSQVRMVAGPGVAAIWRQPTGVPALFVGRAVAPKAFSSGVPFETVRDYLLSLPGLPEGVATQLRTFTGDGSTLPLPVPADRMTTSSAQVGEVQATVLASRDRLLAAVLWVDDGVVTVVAGSLDPGEVVSIARELR